MKIPVVWKSYNPDSPARGYWDQGLIEDLLSNKIWKPVDGFDFMHFPNGFVDHWKELADGTQEGSILVIPARSNAEYIDEINEDIQKFGWVILMLTGDEENIFPVDKLSHPKMKVYVMSPRETLDIEKYRVLGTGYPPQLHGNVCEDAPKALLDFFFAGQVTHGRREEMMEAFKTVSTEDNDLFGQVYPTKGFTQGFDQDDYHMRLSEAKVAVCPSGPETPDTFRLFEALELGCVPIADTRVSKGGFTDKYWRFFFGEEPPFPIISEYSDLRGYIEEQVSQYPAKNNRVYAWWQGKKRQMAYDLRQDIADFSREIINNSPDNKITVVVPVSPIKSHPETYILDETIKSIRHHLPSAEIILTFDGVREEDEERRADYEEFIRRVLWKCNFQYTNVLPVIFDEHSHQTGMARAILDKIKTPLILYVEQDTPLVIDEPIDWDVCVENIMLPGKADVIRFHHEGVIPKEHSHMIHGLLPDSTMFLRTSQWSQRPHLSTVAFYRRILETCFSEGAKSFIEDKMHGICDEAFRHDGLMGWQNYRIVIYYPEGNIKRSYHTDGRAGEAKYESTQVF